jgi:hypothetical protein
MHTLTTPVLLRCMVTNSRKASVSIVAGTVLKREDNTQVLVLVYASRSSELDYVSWSLEAEEYSVRSE